MPSYYVEHVLAKVVDIEGRRDGDFDDEITDAQIVNGLRKELIDPVSLYLYEKAVRARSIASQALKIAAISGTPIKIKEIEYNP